MNSERRVKLLKLGKLRAAKETYPSYCRSYPCSPTHRIRHDRHVQSVMLRDGLRVDEVKLSYTEKEVANLLGIRIRTLQQWRMLGRGPLYRKLGRAVRYPVSDLERWILAQPS